MADIPDSLRDLLEDALKVMRADRFHDLPMGYRCAIYASLGEGAAGQRARACLAWLAAVRVCQPRAGEPGFQTIQSALDYAEQVTHPSGDPPTAFPAGLKNFERGLLQSEDPCGWAALTAAWVAFDDRGLWRKSVPLAQTDERLARADRDAAFYAVCAEAGGPLWYKWQNPDKRRAFWEWWLNEAVPAAYALSQARTGS